MNDSLVWFRRDLRLTDNAVLAQACEYSAKVSCVFVFDTEILSQLKDKCDKRVNFIFESVLELQLKLRRKKSDLIILIGNPAEEIPKLAAKLGVKTVYAGRDYESYAKLRDQKVSSKLKKSSIEFVTLKDQVIFEGSEVRTAADSPYKVFTPYKNTWLKKMRNSDVDEFTGDLSRLIKIQKPAEGINKISQIGFSKIDILFAAGEDAAQKKLKEFSKKLKNYKLSRNIPSLAGTSELSVHFRFGTLSIRQAVRMCRENPSEGSDTWLSELIWRDFYQSILDVFPHVETESFKPEYRNIDWPGREQDFQAWKDGQTGVPIIDAAMRHFSNTGWMHNRLRMIVASFLVKDLLIDWRRGEKYFAAKLLDYDLASNNGGWQWCASTGCDAQPYFRIFNPYSQSEKFDSNGEFIRKHCTELSNYSDSLIHAPHTASLEQQKEAGCVMGKDYPAPIVNHDLQRKIALNLFRKNSS